MNFNLEEELREIITSAIDLNKAKCTHSEIVVDISPNIKRIYHQGEAEGFKKGIDAAITTLQMRERLLADIADSKSPRFHELMNNINDIQKLKQKKVVRA